MKIQKLTAQLLISSVFIPKTQIRKKKKSKSDEHTIRNNLRHQIKKKSNRKKEKKKTRNPKHERELILHTSHVWKTWRNYLWDESKVCKYGGSVVKIQDRISWYWFKFPTSRVSDDFYQQQQQSSTRRNVEPPRLIFSPRFPFVLRLIWKLKLGILIWFCFFL